MSRKSKKTVLLDIMRIILSEYKEVTHKIDITSCGLCQEFMDKDESTCGSCPMHVFKKHHFYPCIDRNCEPVDCNFLSPDDIDLLRVIKFYELVIARIESMSVDAVRKSSFKFLISIDNEVRVL